MVLPALRAEMPLSLLDDDEAAAADADEANVTGSLVLLEVLE